MRVIRDIHSKGEARNVTVKLNHPSSRDRRRVSLIKPVSRVCPGCHHIIDHRSSIIDHRSSIIDHRSSIIDHRIIDQISIKAWQAQASMIA
jgi:hypothetical protein